MTWRTRHSPLSLLPLYTAPYFVRVIAGSAVGSATGTLLLKLATAIGPLTFGIATKLAGNNFRIAMLTTLLFFFAGMVLAVRVNERRGILAAEEEDQRTGSEGTVLI